MKPSQHAFELIKKWEQLRCRAYKALPSEKYYTIGYGHYGADVKPNQVMLNPQTYGQARTPLGARARPHMKPR